MRLRLIAEEQVKRALERIEGVAAVVVSGGLEEEIQVELDERRLANLGLTADRVVEPAGRRRTSTSPAAGCARGRPSSWSARSTSSCAPRTCEPIVIDSTRGRDRAPGGRGPRRHGPQGARDHHADRRRRRASRSRSTRRAAPTRSPSRTRCATASTSCGSGCSRSTPSLELTVDHRPGALHPRVGHRGAANRALRRHAGDPGAVLLPAQLEDDGDHRHGDPGLGRRHLLPDVRLGDLAEHHVAGRADAGHRPAGGQLDRRARGDPAPARRGAAARSRPPGRAPARWRAR